MVAIPEIDLSDEERKLLETIWGERELGIRIPLAPAWRPDAIHETLEAIRNQVYPFLQIINSKVSLAITPRVRPVFTSVGWVIYDYGDAMSSAPPHEMIKQLEEAGWREHEEKAGGAEGGEGEGGAEGDAGSVGTDHPGTIIKQQADVAYLMMEFAKKKGWIGAELVAGTMLMRKYAWVAAKMLGFSFANYSPTDDDYKTLERVKTLKQEVAKRATIVRRPRVGQGQVLTK